VAVIDTKRGGTVQGELDALNRLMDLSIHNLPIQWHPDRTLLVPGHGFVYDKLDLLEYRDAVTVVRDRVLDLIGQGMSLAQVKAANPTLGYRSQYGADSGPGRLTCSSRPSITSSAQTGRRANEPSPSVLPPLGGRMCMVAAVLIMCGLVRLDAQRGNAQPPSAPRAAAPIDLTGYWVSIVTQDWRWRMVTPAKGDYQGIQMTPEGERLPTPGIQPEMKPPASNASPTVRPR
jgi:hypothetical protein